MNKQNKAGSTRLVTFLGTGKYQSTHYSHPDGRTLETAYVAHAIARLWNVDEVVVLATKEAEAAHAVGLREALSGKPAPILRPIPSGRSEEELWKQFEVLSQALEGEGGLILDITHGFRSQPFFAAGALSYLRMVGTLGGRDVAVLYGRYLPEEPLESPIWDLTPFVELLDWAQGAALLVATGHGKALVEVARRSDRTIRRRMAQAGLREFPNTLSLVSALEDFTDDLATVRIAALVTGYAQDDKAKPTAQGSAARLLQALDNYEREAVAHIPALGPVLSRVRKVAEGIPATSLAGASGEQAAAVLARRYLEFARYPEAAVVLREALVSRHAAGREAVEVNCPAFDTQARRAAEVAWAENDRQGQRRIAHVRNDIEHGGFNRQPQAAKDLTAQLRKLVDEQLPEQRDDTSGCTWFVSRHPGAREWAARCGIQVDRQVDHLDPSEVRPGDTVIGTLPVHLVAEVCGRNARYLNLSIDLPAEFRGRELDADDLDRFKARLEAFRVSPGC